MHTAKTMKSPVKITQAKITPKYGKNEVTIGRYASIQVLNNLNFTCMDATPQESLSSLSTNCTLDDLQTPGKKVKYCCK